MKKDKLYIEESFPVKELSEISAKEKNIRHGHISTLHIWWARRPLASSRATNYSALIPASQSLEEWEKTRQFIIDLSKWENSLDRHTIEKARKDILEANGERPPRVLDCFAGGGSIPLEALRLGCEVHAIEYNPVAVLILKCILEYPQKYGKPREIKKNGGILGKEIKNPLLEDVKRWGNWILEEAKKEIGKFYPADDDGSIPVGYIWARTLICQNPACAAEIPLMRQFWLVNTNNKKVALYPYVEDKKVKFKIVGTGYENMPSNFDPKKGTVSRAIAVCPVCGSVIDDKTTRKLFQEGKAGQKMVAVVLNKPGTKGKIYRLATEKDIEIFKKAEKYLEEKRQKLMEEWGIDPVPDEAMNIKDPNTVAGRGYGFTKWGELFNSRQKLALITFIEKVKKAYHLMVGQPSRLSNKMQPINQLTITKRHLPHWQSPNAVYFITTRCAEGKSLDPSQRDIVMEAIRYLDKKKYILYATVIMPDHFHLMIQPLEKGEGGFFSLSEIMHSIKSFTSHKIGGSVWQHENFDRIIRNEEEFFEKMHYILNNPVKANIVDEPDKYKWLYYIGGLTVPVYVIDNNGLDINGKINDKRDKRDAFSNDKRDAFSNDKRDACPTSTTSTAIYFNDPDYAKAVMSYIGICLDRVSIYATTFGCWHNTRELVTSGMARQALGMTWDYAELNFFGGNGDWTSALDWILNVLSHLSQIPPVKNNGAQIIPTVKQASATELPYPDNYFDAVFTDPPYYDNINYAELSDFFYVWLKRSIGNLYPELFMTPLVPKSKEIVSNPVRHGGEQNAKQFFEEMLKKAFKEIARVLKPNGIATIVYTHKSTSGWETLINSLLESGLVPTASWPIDTEMKTRLVAKESAALASSIYFVCRKIERKETGWLSEVKDEIKNHIQIKLEKLWEEGVSGADYFIAGIGSAIEIFGKYKKIMDYEGNEIKAKELIEYVREVVTDYAVRQILHNGIAGELSPLTRFYILCRWTYGTAKIEFDEARKLAQSTGVNLEKEWNKSARKSGAGFIKKEKEFIILLGPQDRTLEELESAEEMIDILHKVLILWKEGRKEKMKQVLRETGYGTNDAFYRVAQAISETLPNESREKKLIDGFLSGKEKLKDEIKNMDERMRLFE